MIERRWNADLLAKIFGLVFLLVGIIGFIPNPLVSETGYFQVNEAHNLIHIVTGLLFLAGAYFDAPVWTIRAIAVLYTIVAIVGFAIPENPLFGVVAMNVADHWLHAAFAVVLLLIGFVTPVHQPLRQAHL
jgi:hypothetical protein